MSSIDPTGRLLRREEIDVPTTNGAGTIRESKREATRRIAQEAFPMETLGKVVGWGITGIIAALVFFVVCFVVYLGVAILRGIF